MIPSACISWDAIALDSSCLSSVAEAKKMVKSDKISKAKF